MATGEMVALARRKLPVQRHYFEERENRVESNKFTRKGYELIWTSPYMHVFEPNPSWQQGNIFHKLVHRSELCLSHLEAIVNLSWCGNQVEKRWKVV